MKLKDYVFLNTDTFIEMQEKFNQYAISEMSDFLDEYKHFDSETLIDFVKELPKCEFTGYLIAQLYRLEENENPIEYYINKINTTISLF
jgi:hypothetical protein